MRLKIKTPLYEFIFFLSIIGLLYILGLLTSIKESFQNPFEEIIRKIKEMQNQSGAYDKWIGYVYKYSSKNGKILNDFKSKVFKPSCRFRGDWATNLPKGMTIPTPAETPDMAMIAYKNYFNSLNKGEGNSVKQLYNARDRFMAPGCNFLNNPEGYIHEYTVAFV